MVEANIPAAEVTPAAVVEDSNAGPINAPGAGETITLQERPEWVPEKFFKDGVVNFREMAKSYGELEKSKGAPAPVKAEVTPAAAITPEPIKHSISEPLAIPGVAAPEIAKYTDELTTAGKLSPESYANLQKAGYPKAMVDAYVKGLMADATQAEAVSQARIADKQIAEITTSVGGEKVLGEMIAWATANLEPADLAAYNEAVSSSDVSKVKMAVNGLFHSFSQGADPALLRGDKKGDFTNGVEPFNSNDEVVRAMQNPLYETDEAYRQKVAERIRVSNVFSQSRDVTHESFARHQS